MERRVFPCLDIHGSGTHREELHGDMLRTETNEAFLAGLRAER